MAIVCDGYPEIKVSRENFVSMQLAVGGLADELLEKEFTTSSLIFPVPKGQPLWYAKTKKPSNGQLVKYQP